MKLLDLLQMSDVLSTAQPPTPTPQAPPGPEQGMMPGMPPGADQAGGEDNIATGALPMGTEPPPVPFPAGGPGSPV